MYHSIYETIYYVETFLDPAYRRHVSCTQFSGLLMQYFSGKAFNSNRFNSLLHYWRRGYIFDTTWKVCALGGCHLVPCAAVLHFFHCSEQQHLAKDDRYYKIPPWISTSELNNWHIMKNCILDIYRTLFIRPNTKNNYEFTKISSQIYTSPLFLYYLLS